MPSERIPVGDVVRESPGVCPGLNLEDVEGFGMCGRRERESRSVLSECFALITCLTLGLQVPPAA